MAEIKTIKDGLIEMSCAIFGNGKRNFVMLPGLSVKNASENAETVKNMYKRYLDDFTFYLIDRRKNVPYGYSISDMADDTAKVLHRLGVEKADFFGASQGGIIALIIAAKYPETVNKVAVASSVIKNRKEVIAEWVNLARKKDRKSLAKSFTENIYSEKFQNLYKDAIFAQAETYTDEELERFVIIADTITNFDVTETVKKVNCPTIIIASESDNVFGSEATKHTAAAINNSELFVYKNTYGHAIYDEAPDFADRIMSFLK